MAPDLRELQECRHSQGDDESERDLSPGRCGGDREAQRKVQRGVGHEINRPDNTCRKRHPGDFLPVRVILNVPRQGDEGDGRGRGERKGQ